MRLEQLFEQLDHFMIGSSVWDSRAVITSLLDLHAVFSRNDVKSETLKELDRHSAALTKMAKNHQDLDPSKLDVVLSKLDGLSRELYGTPGKICPSLMDNELFKSISQRNSIPGSTCSFDLPAFHYWLQRGDDLRKRDLEEWIRPFKLIRYAIDTLLNFIRTCAIPAKSNATAGFFQKTLDHTLPYQLLRVGIERSAPYYAEISGGKHRFTIRFMMPDIGQRSIQCNDDINFKLTCCML